MWLLIITKIINNDCLLKYKCELDQMKYDTNRPSGNNIYKISDLIYLKG